MDKFDELIVRALMENGRLSYAELARRVNLSSPAVAERVAKLEAKKSSPATMPISIWKNWDWISLLL
ncbi:AsnC family protein [Acerihabitans sp. KWT182]|uniref:AsnC family protein n=1 Tax=Acerihabitans sp. KWT182 TaxID=3157919 RepID=A0AAU7QCT8_9GAMM